MFSAELQQKEIETIKERTIKINLSDADCDKISKLCGEHGITVAELLENFIGDLVGGTYSNGSDECDLAQEYFDRCGFGMFGEKTLLRHLLSWDRDLEEYLQLLGYIEQAEEDKKYMEEHPEEADENEMLCLNENIEWWNENLEDMREGWEPEEEPDMEKENRVIREWAEAKKRLCENS